MVLMRVSKVSTLTMMLDKMWVFTVLAAGDSELAATEKRKSTLIVLKYFPKALKALFYWSRPI